MNTLYKKRLNFFPEFFYIDIISNKNDNMHFIKNLKIFPEFYSKNCSSKPASKNLPVGVGLHRWGVVPTHIPTDVSRETFVMFYSIRYANKNITN